MAEKANLSKEILEKTLAIESNTSAKMLGYQCIQSGRLSFIRRVMEGKTTSMSMANEETKDLTRRRQLARICVFIRLIVCMCGLVVCMCGLVVCMCGWMDE